MTLSAYRKLFGLPRFGSSLVAAVAGKLRPGIASLALLLEVAHYRDLNHAALVVSVSALAGATLPLRGRLMDRYGHGLMGVELAAYLMALTAVVCNDRARGPFAVTVAGAFVAGLSAPPVQIATRLMWRELTTGELRTTILSLDAMLADVGFIVGPTLAAFLVAAVAPWAGLAVSALLCAGATVLLIARGLPAERAEPPPARRHWLGPLREGALRRTMAATVVFLLAVRAIELAFPVWAQQHHSPLLSGVLLSCMSVGSVAGGLLLGALPAPWSDRATLPATLGVLCVGTLLAAAASVLPTAALVVAATLMGVALGPSFVALWATAGDLSPAHMSAETLSWISSFMSLGGAVGAAVGGVVASALGPGALLVLAAVFLGVGSGLARPTRTAALAAAGRTPGIDVHRAVKVGE